MWIANGSRATALALAFATSNALGSNILFQDDFNDGNANGWQEFDGSFSVVGGEYHVKSNSFSNDARSVAGDPTWTDYVIDVDFKQLDARAAAILFRVESIESGTDAGRYYQFHVFPTFSGFCEMNFSGGNCNRLIDVSYSTPTNTWHHARLVVDGNTATAYLDSNFVLSYSGFSGYPAGRIALKSINGVENIYDNVVVSAIPIPAAVWLFGSAVGLAGAGVTRRRRPT